MRLSLAHLGLLLAALVGGDTLRADERLDFRTSILPLFTKAGCNAGACHGAAVGQGGFKLSLLGYDPAADHAHLTRELGGRRLDAETPAESLFFRKGSGQLDHEGGRKIKRGSETEKKLLAWIAQGAPFGPDDLSVTGIRVEPADSLLPEPGHTVQLHVTAILSDGRQETVTPLALFSSNDDAVAEVNATGLVTLRERGITSIMVRYSGQAVAARVAVPFGNLANDWIDFLPHNFIDTHVLAELRRSNLPASPLSDDAEFFRRVHLDLIGRLPEPQAVRAFLDQPPSDGKRKAAIASLLGREEFIDFWALKFGDWLLLNGKRGSEGPARVYHEWVREQLSRNRPLDQFVRDLLLAQGEVTHVGPANFYNLATDPRDLAEHVGSMFLGAQIACARCHAHPADRWTQEDYHAFAAYFSRVTRKGQSIELSTAGEMAHPKTEKPVAPRPLGAQPAPAPATGDRRVELAAWLTGADNPFFARNLVNRVWKHLLGRALVEPVDDLRPTNPPSNPALLDALAAQFAAHGFDLRWLVRVIAESRTYQLTSRSNSGNGRDERLFSHAYLKPLPAQVFADAVAQVTGVPDQFEGEPAGTRAVQLAGVQTPSYALDVLGRCGRERSCETPGSAGGGLAQALHLINGVTINDKLRGGTLDRLLSKQPASQQLVEELYLRALSRRPGPDEQREWTRRLDRAHDRATVAEDLLWALLNSREFAFNH